MRVVGAEPLVRFRVNGDDVGGGLGGGRRGGGKLGAVFFEEGAIVGVAAALGAEFVGLWCASEEGEEAHDYNFFWEDLWMGLGR